MLERPAPGEFAPFYGTYIRSVPDGDILRTLEVELHRTLALLASVPPALETQSYAPGKWTVREVVGHLIDAERVFGVRALTFARRDPGPLPGFHEDAWASASNAGARPLSELAGEFQAVRTGHLFLLRGLDGEAGTREGTASGAGVTVRALAWIMAGHQIHHRVVLQERYLG